jgi:tRNA modification GTPase
MLRAEIEARLDFSDEGDVDETVARNIRADSKRAVGRITIRTGLHNGRTPGPRGHSGGAGRSAKRRKIEPDQCVVEVRCGYVSPEAGTTRDVREVPLDLGGHLFLLLDLAGLRETESLAEREGVRRARQAMESADVILWLVAPDVPDEPTERPAGRVVRVATKSDLAEPNTEADLVVSAKDGRGIDQLLTYLRDSTSDLVGGEPGLISHERDRVALVAAIDAIGAVGDVLGRPELAAERLRQASASLERLIGRVDAEQVLDQLFLRFCIGK